VQSEFGKIVQRGGGGRNDDFSAQIQNEFLKLLEPGATLLNGRFGDTRTLPLNSLIILSDALSFVKSVNTDMLSRQDLISAGFIPELAGRIQLVDRFIPLEIEHFERIMLDGEATVVREKVNFCGKLGITLTFEKDAIHEIAVLAKNDGSGGRSLNHVVNLIVDTELKKRVFDGDVKDRDVKTKQMIQINKAVVRSIFPVNNGAKPRCFGFGT